MFAQGTITEQHLQDAYIQVLLGGLSNTPGSDVVQLARIVTC
jgi:hypothetical protein